MKSRYFAYIRVSTVKQGEGVSLAEQKSAIAAYAERNGLAITRWFEEMETAAKQGRRQFTQMLAALSSGKADGLIIHKIDRSARNLKDWASLGDLIDRGVDVRFVNDNLDLRSTGGRLTADLQAAIAAHYIRNLREEVKKGLYGRLKQGLYPWHAPLGYRNNGKAKPKTIDPVTGPLVRRMFERYASNTISFEDLRREMYGLGLRTRGGKVLPLNALSRALNNPFYMGVIRMGSGETYPGIQEPLISKALFDRVQTILRGKTVAKAKKHRFLLRQMVKCACCGRRTLTGELQRGTPYYRCHGRTCRGRTWRGDALEGVVREHFARIRLAKGRQDEKSNVTRGCGDVGTKNTNITPIRGVRDEIPTITLPNTLGHTDFEDLGDIGDLREMVMEVCHAQKGDTERLRASLALQLKHIDGRVSRLTDLLIDQAIDRDAYHARKEQFLKDRQGILEELKRTEARSPLADLFDEFERNNTALLRYESLTDDEKRELVDIVCSNFSVCGESLTFTLRSPYKEIAEVSDSLECAQDRKIVRLRKIAEILKEFSNRQIESGVVQHISPSYARPDHDDAYTSPQSP